MSSVKTGAPPSWNNDSDKPNIFWELQHFFCQTYPAKHCVVVCLGRVDLAQQKSGLRTALLSADVSRHREPRLQDFGCVRHRRFQQLLEVRVLRQVVVTRLLPLINGLKYGKGNL